MLPAIYCLAHFINVRFPPGNTCFEKIIIALMSRSGKQNKKKLLTNKNSKPTNKQKAKDNNKSVSLWLVLYCDQSFVILDIF